MPRMLAPSYDLPGYRQDGLGSFSATIEGGSLDGEYSTMMYADLPVAGAENPTIRIAVRTGTTQAVTPLLLNHWISEEETFAESERYAHALSRSWRLEEYTFSHWVKPGKLKRRKAVYRFNAVHTLLAVPGERRWRLETGSRTEIVAGTPAPDATKDGWDSACAEVEAAADTFHRIADLFPEELYREQLEGPKRAVEVSRTEARRVAALGQQLDQVTDPSGRLQRTLDQTRAQLEALRLNVLEAVRLVSEVQLEIPEIFPSIVREAGELDLVALRGASRELAGGE